MLVQTVIPLIKAKSIVVEEEPEYGGEYFEHADGKEHGATFCCTGTTLVHGIADHVSLRRSSSEGQAACAGLATACAAAVRRQRA